MRELELKLSVDDPFVTPALRPDGVDIAGMEELPELDLRATYYDTEDLRLARHGLSLRHRTGEGDESGWTLKLPVNDGDGAARDEIRLEARTAEAKGEAEYQTITGEGRAKGYEAMVRALGKEQIAQLELLKLVAEGKVQITPQVMVTGNGGPMDALAGTILRQSVQSQPGAKP